MISGLLEEGAGSRKGNAMNAMDDALRIATEAEEYISDLFQGDNQSVMRQFYLSCSKEVQDELQRMAETVEALLSANWIETRAEVKSYIFCPPHFYEIWVCGEGIWYK